MRLVLSLTVLTIGIAIARQPLSMAAADNELALCWLHAESAEQTCQQSLDRMIDRVPFSRRAKLTSARYMGLADEHERLIAFLADEEPQRLGSLTAHALLNAYRQTGDIEKAAALVSVTHIPDRVIVLWSLEASQQGKKEEARIWLHLADVNGAKLDWVSRQWLGYLWGDVGSNVDKALVYLEPVHAESPDAVYPAWLLGIIYRSTSIDRSVEILEHAYALEPVNLSVIRDLMLSYTIRGRSEDLEKSEQLRLHAIDLLVEYLRTHPDNQDLRQWLTQLRESKQ